MEVSTRQQMWKNMFGDVIEKDAELAGTYDMPGSQPQNKREKDKKTTIQKTAAIGRALQAEFMREPTDDELLKAAFDVGPEDNEEDPVAGEQPPALPQSGELKPKVDVSGQEPPQVVQKKEAQYYAVPSQRRYPMDGYDQVKMAAAYFDEHWKEMPPSMRREYAANLVKRAGALSVPTSDTAKEYGGDRAGSTHIKVAFDARRMAITDEAQMEVLDKLASAAHMMDGDSLATCLAEFDRMACIDYLWGGDVPDPYRSVFTKTAEAQEGETAPDESIIIGNEYITARDLVEFSKLRQQMVKDRFGDEFAEEFTKDPRAIFDSLPRDQKLVIMRMANTSDSPVEGASAS